MNQQTTNFLPTRLSDDLLEGADAIAVELFGDAKHRRKVYHLDSLGELPTFRLGAKLCCLRSKLREHINSKMTTGREVRA
ncbi:hypothetical protein FBZ83_12375 [Azospirillum brasilense]|uniref:DNA-binding protein n=1 Tax=Azospirillum brasilense TaxID=192 RepID=A0A560BSQ2_AZOBR|nr:hypothetical protein [Azospirillum brasilense]TWA75648.1 hypothetical protein FBZ83_12375 [Azospirillum brasilense]